MDFFLTLFVAFVWMLGCIVYVYAWHFDVIVNVLTSDNPHVLEGFYARSYRGEYGDYYLSVPTPTILIIGVILGGVVLYFFLRFVLSKVRGRFAVNNQISVLDGREYLEQNRLSDEHGRNPGAD